MASNHPNSGPDPAVIVVIPLLIFVTLFIFWSAFKEPLYWYSGVMAKHMLWPLSFIKDVDVFRQQIGVQILQPPSVGQTFSWVSAAWRLPAMIVAIFVVRSGMRAFKHPIVSLKGGMRGALSVDALMRYQAQIHPSIAPIVPIAKDMHKRLDPRWHPPFHPHEVVQANKLANADGTLNIEKSEQYFLKQLGTRIYRPGIDAPGQVFVDRLNNYEKVIFALLAPLALHINKGIPEYRAVSDALARSAVNPAQTPNLLLASDLWKKYRTDKRLNNLAMGHHFSTTFLMQLYILAKRSGKVTTAEWCGWLRPNANGLYAALNCARRETPFTECAGPFFQWKFELYCRKKGYMPVLPVMGGVAQSLKDEWDFYVKADPGVTEESLWGRLADEGSQQNQEMYRRHVTDLLQPGVIAEAPGAQSAFDDEESAARGKFTDEALTAAMSGLNAVFGVQKKGTS